VSQDYGITASSTIHYDLISNLVVLLRQVIPLQDINQMNLIFKNCWFFLELTLKSICLYAIQYKSFTGNKHEMPVFEEDFYVSLQSFFDLITESIVKYAPTIMTVFAKDPEFGDSFKSCNRSLAMFIKVSTTSHFFLILFINHYYKTNQSNRNYSLKLLLARIRIDKLIR